MTTTLSLLAFYGCRGLSGGSGRGSGDEQDDDSPAVHIETPSKGDQLYGDVTMRWSVENFTIDLASVGAEDVDGVGHVHVYLDGELVEDGAKDSYVYTGLDTSVHTLEVRLTGNDDVELPFSDEVSLNTCEPEVTVTGPAGPLAASSGPLGVEVQGFTLSDAFGHDAAFGEGHYVVRADGRVLSRGIDPTTASVTRLSEGDHSIEVELLNNDDSPLEPPVVSDPVTVSVAPGSPYIGFMDAYDGVWNSGTLPLHVHTANVFGGSYHVYLDGLWSGAGVTMLGHLTPGRHDVRAVLTDPTGRESSVFDESQVYVADGRPDLRITSPGESWTVHPDVQLSVSAENFKADGQSRDGHGRYEVDVDGVAVGSGTGSTISVSGLPLGAHTIRVALVHSGGSPLEPAVWDEIHVNVN